MEDVGEQLQPVDDPRAGAREVRRGVDRDHAARPQRLELVGVGLRLLQRALGVVAARHHHDDLGRGRGHLLPTARLRRLARQPEHVEAARVLDHLRRPVARAEDRVEPLQRGDGDAVGGPYGQPHAVDPARGGGDELDAGVLGVGGLGERADVAQDLPDRVRVERDHLRLRVHPLGHGADVVVGHRADGAQGLRDDQIRLQRAQRILVELVDRAAGGGELPHRAVDLVRRQAGPDHVARDLGQLQRLARVVALVGHGGNLVAEPEGEQGLGGRGDE